MNGVTGCTGAAGPAAMTAKSQTELEQEVGRKAVARRAQPIAPETAITASPD